MSIDRSPTTTSTTRRPLLDRTGPVLRSPAEAMEPRRAPARPRSLKEKKPPRKLGPNLRAFNAFLTFVAVLLAAVAFAVVAFEAEVDAPGPLKEVRTFTVRDREGAQDIAKRLEAEGIISSFHVFVAHYLARSAMAGGDKQRFVLKTGEYQFEPAASIREIADAIGKGRSLTFTITIPEGLTSNAIVERLRAEAGLTGDILRVPPEGTLMPDTYRVPKGMARSQVIEMMQAEHKKFLAKIWEERQPGVPVKSIEDAVILASIVEKETGRRDERERVAAVFVNRLKKGMRLQSDPTILYGLAQGQVRWGKPITRSDINSRTAHNTYVISALPPTPICNPGRASITAALKPAATNEIYFVADGQGGHIFSETLKEHNSAVANWRKTEREIRARQAAAAQQKAQAGQQAQAAGASEEAVPAQVLAAEMEEETPQRPAPPQRKSTRRN